ncbi:MAG: hypothetical protein AMS16_06345 [Planctomycetes bacterium DG_58]|nr:MAG: hypothetical protein AMS16_06345 [Planctomycetes bacterium DG_58]
MLPVVCAGVAAQDNPLEPEWQSGEFKDYVALLGSRDSASPFYPLMLYAMICMGLVLGNLQRFGRLFVVRFGLLTGVILGFQYAAIMGISLDWGDEPWLIPANVAVGTALPLVLFGVWVWARNRLGWRLALLFAIPVGLIPPMSLVLLAPGITLRDVCIVAYIFVLGGAPFWAFTVYSVATLWTWKRVRMEPMRVWIKALVASTWMTAYAVAWWYALLKMFEAYAALPTSPPSCYVATAAARGHGRLVKSEPVVLGHGTALHVNPQMRTLKCAELLLKAASPRIHRTCRRIYDTLGPPLAACLVHPVLADAAYLALKPVEWLAKAVMRLLIPKADDLADRIYHP